MDDDTMAKHIRQAVEQVQKRNRTLRLQRTAESIAAELGSPEMADEIAELLLKEAIRLRVPVEMGQTLH